MGDVSDIHHLAATAFCGDTRGIAEAVSRSMSRSTYYHQSVALFDELASVRSLFAVCPLCDCPAVCDAADRMSPTHTEH